MTRVESRIYYKKALDLVADELEKLKVEDFEHRRAKIIAIIRMASYWMEK